jgi:aminotransferase
MRLSRVVEAVPPSGIRRFFDIVSQMEDVISLGVGEPDFVTPWRIREAAIYSLEKGFTTYTSNYGLLELRQAIAHHLDAVYGVEYSPTNEVLVTVGVSEGLDLALRAILNPGDEVLVPEPCYVSYQPCTLFAGGTPVPVPGDPEDGFTIRAAALEAAVTPRTRALLLNFPNNPTGATLRSEEMVRIAALAEQHDLWVISDEIYAQLTYEGKHVSFAALPGMQRRTILLNGFSKAYAMTGWRIGYAAGPAEAIGAMTKVHQYTMLCAGITAQMAALEALRNGERDTAEMVAQYDARRRLIVGGLNALGLACRMPEGAFYAFPSIAGTGLDSETFAERLLHQERVAVVPGNAFGDCGEGHIRCSYAASVADLEEALRRIGRFVRQCGMAQPARGRGAVTAPGSEGPRPADPRPRTGVGAVRQEGGSNG